MPGDHVLLQRLSWPRLLLERSRQMSATCSVAATVHGGRLAPLLASHAFRRASDRRIRQRTLGIWLGRGGSHGSDRPDTGMDHQTSLRDHAQLDDVVAAGPPSELNMIYGGRTPCIASRYAHPRRSSGSATWMGPPTAAHGLRGPVAGAAVEAPPQVRVLTLGGSSSRTRTSSTRPFLSSEAQRDSRGESPARARTDAAERFRVGLG